MEYFSYKVQPKSNLNYYYKENEINSFNYDSTLSVSNGYLRAPLKESPKENVELSVEVEIANSVKRVNTSPQKDDSSLLDVTIVRPNLNSESNQLSNADLKTCPVKELLTVLKRQNCSNRQTQEKDKDSSNSHKIVERKSAQGLQAMQRKLRRFKSPKTRDIVTLPVLQKDGLKPLEHLGDFERLRPTRDRQINRSSMTIVKPPDGEIEQPLKVLENNVGDYLNLPNDNFKCRNERGSHSYNYDKSHVYSMELPNTHQIYATTNAFDKLKNLYSCQNPDKEPNPKLSFCSCNNCEMIGVLMDSQKRPFINSVSQKKKNSNSSCKGHSITEDNYEYNSSSKKNATENKFRRFDYENMCLLRELANRLNNLEQRVTEQEQNAVPKDYFKRIIRKVIEQTQKVRSLDVSDSSKLFKNTATQFSRMEKAEKDSISKKTCSTPKYRNVQIQQNKRRDYVVNQVAVKDEAKSKSSALENSNFKEIGTNAISVISDFFMKKQDENKPGDNNSALDNFLRWGEEIIKPGFDLKTKILHLLDEQLGSITSSKPSEKKCENKNSKKETDEISAKNISKTESISVYENSSPANSSNRTLKKMLNLMSEKIYADHVKPTINSLRKDKTSANISSTKNSKKGKVERTNKPKKREPVASSKSIEWKKDFLEPLQVPSSIRSIVDDSKLRGKTAQSIKRSGIPVRVTNTQTVESIPNRQGKNREKDKANIPYFNAELKDNLKFSEKSLKRSKYSDKYRKKQSKKKLSQKENEQEPDSESVEIKYVSPKAKCWNDDSTVSVTVITSQDSILA